MLVNKNLEIEWQNILLAWMRWLQNLWDELILLWNIKLLQKQNKNIFITSSNTTRLKAFLSKEVDCSNITFIDELPRWFKSFFRYIKSWDLKQLKLFFKIDTVILWWWEILTEETKTAYRYRLCSIWPTLFFKKKLYIMWWVQIPQKKINKRLFNRILKHTKHIYCRDFEWVKELKKYWFKNVDFFMDTSFFARDDRKKYKQITKKHLIININKGWIRFIQDLKNTLKQFNNKGYKIFFIPVSNWWNDTHDKNILNKRLIPNHLKDTENDLKYLPELKKDFPQIEIYDRAEDLEKFFYLLWSAEMVISPRLHLYLINSFIWGKTMVYPYQKKILKMQNVINELNINPESLSKNSD